MDDAAYIFTVVALAIILTIFNVFTIIVMVMNRKLRRPANFPVISFLIGSAIQGALPAPAYIAKKIEHDRHIPLWLCDTYRFPYFLCGHVMKVSLLVVSVERLLAIRCPFRYTDIVTKKRMIALLVGCWVLVLGIDLIPFFNGSTKNGKCQYIPMRLWGITVIILFNIIPFFVMAFSYAWIWKIAASMEMKDRMMQESLKQEEPETLVCKSRKIKTIGKQRSTESDQLTKRRLSNKRVRILRYAFEMKATKTSLMVVAVYVVCWGPLGVFYIIDHFCHNCLSDDPNVHMSRTRMAIKLLCFTSSVLAPLVYCWRTKEFQQIAKRACCDLRYSCHREADILNSTASS